ncbi:uncharacterized protein LOC122505969 [Leptopilina heterotoma]|uniref:uncharacterized protein LOC122505969 n=1 Tax=Leptopilina heterotoma TaxID=63436 RepID=UPI001CA82047|nr:uncharacterized protein LOC122505969 [Leptopilina heterotoma]
MENLSIPTLAVENKERIKKPSQKKRRAEQRRKAIALQLNNPEVDIVIPVGKRKRNKEKQTFKNLIPFLESDISISEFEKCSTMCSAVGAEPSTSEVEMSLDDVMSLIEDEKKSNAPTEMDEDFLELDTSPLKMTPLKQTPPVTRSSITTKKSKQDSIRDVRKCCVLNNNTKTLDYLVMY